MNAARDSNGFDALRLLAALSVIYSHGYLAGREQGHMFHNFGYEDIGAVAVSVFFAISGYLVTQSWLTDPHLERFFVKRCLRIFPALIIVVALSALVIGPLLTSLSLSSYFSNAETWLYFLNIGLFDRQDYLPGVFTKNPVSTIVNGPIWSLPYEFACYGVVALCGECGLYRNQFGNLFVFLLFFATVVIASFAAGLDQVAGIPVFRNMRHVEAFMAGSLLATGDYKLLPKYFLIPCVLGLASMAMFTTQMVYVFPVVVAFLSVYVGKNLKISIGKDDYSYGLYLWGYVIQQILAAKCRFLDDWPNIGLAVCLSFFPAMLSWHLIEKRMLKMKPLPVGK